MNKCIFTGNLTRDPEFTTTRTGVPRCAFSVAVQSKTRNDQGEYEVDFINIVAWRGTAEFCAKHLKKGVRVAIGGALRTSTYQAQDGTRRTSFSINAEEVEMLSKIEGESKPSVKPETTPVDEELPF